MTFALTSLLSNLFFEFHIYTNLNLNSVFSSSKRKLNIQQNKMCTQNTLLENAVFVFFLTKIGFPFHG